jgi:predicted CXXCH cytochrome family protein
VKQLIAEPVDTCMTCHKAPIVVDKTRTIAATNELTAPQFHKHGPIEKGDCAGCHDVHGGKNDSLLVAPYEKSFYQAYTDTAYALCFRCHQRSLVLSQSTDKDTGFRNGTRNLHTVHVDKATQGRSCRACHTVHASRFETMIADKVAFGDWSLPINYKNTPSGGSCAPGCHRPAQYDRDTPFENPMSPLPSRSGPGAPQGAPAPSAPSPGKG